MCAKPERPGLVAGNLIALVAWGVILSAWMLWYTDWFPVVGGLLGLTGAFSWIAFLANLVPDARKSQLQAWFDSRVLQRYWPLAALSGLSLAFVLLFTSWHGTLVIDALGDGTARTAELRPVGQSEEANPLRLGSAARSERTVLLPTGFFSSESYRLKLEGLPAIEIEIVPWSRTSVVVPVDFLTAPVVLLRPSATMSGEASTGEFSLLVRTDDEEYGRITDYRGESVWIGAREDVQIPAGLLERWRLDLMSQNLPTDLARRWTVPRSIVGSAPLKRGTEITAIILREPDRLGDGDAGIQGQVAEKVVGARRGADFPQEVVIDVAGTTDGGL